MPSAAEPVPGPMFDDLLEACRRNDVERVRALVVADPALLTREDASSGETPLLAALYRGHRATGGWLLTQDAPWSVFEAAAADLTDRLGALLDEHPGRADTYSTDGWTPLHLAAFFGSSGAAALLLARGADHRSLSRNATMNTPLHAALAGRQLAVVDLLLAAGADPTVDCAGHTPLAIAEGNGFLAGAERIRAALAGGAA